MLEYKVHFNADTIATSPINISLKEKIKQFSYWFAQIAEFNTQLITYLCVAVSFVCCYGHLVMCFHGNASNR
jgi:hypothetical protein